MLISQIIGGKANTEIITVKPGQMISEAAAILSEKRIGALVVSKDGTSITGILSERDIVRRLGQEGKEVLERKVSDLMTSPVETITPDQTGEAALKIMTKRRFRHMPVVDDGKLVGVISIGDVVSARLAEIEAENSALANFVAGNA